MGEVIEPACAKVGLDAVRADTLARAGEITEQIFRRLHDDDVVIADLTDANPNVMYELGLRHARDKLTIQIGEFGRLPFDVNTIRTIQFSRSAIGLINARDELIPILTAGLAGEYDPVTATRVWHEVPSPPADDNSLRHAEATNSNATDSQEDLVDDDKGFLDTLVEAEDQQDEWMSSLEAMGSHINALGDLAASSGEEIARNDAAGRGARGRLQVAAKYAAGIDQVVPSVEADADRYVDALASVSAGMLAIIKSLEDDPGQLEGQEAMDAAMSLRRLATISRESLSALASMVESIDSNAKLARVLREPSRRLTDALNHVVEATSAMDEWDRRLQLLGIPVPPEGWEPQQGDQDEVDQGSQSADDGDQSEPRAPAE